MSDAEITEFIKKSYRQLCIPLEDGQLQVEIFELGCVAVRKNATAAFKAVQKMGRQKVKDILGRGEQLPEPYKLECRSRHVLHLDPELHRRAAIEAADQGVSLNTYFVTKIAERVGMIEGIESAAKHFVNQMPTAHT